MKDLVLGSIFGLMTPDEIAERNKDKRNSIIVWLARYSFSTIVILATLLRIDERNVRSLLKKMTEEGLLKTELLVSGQRVFGLSPSGVAQAGLIDAELAKVATVYQLGRLPLSTLPHHINIQLAELSLSWFGWTYFSSGRELYSLNMKQVPDLVAYDQSDMVVAIEIELNLKSSQRMKVICENYAAVTDSRPDAGMLFQRILYLTPYPDRLKNLLDKFVPAEKRGLFEVDTLFPLPVNLTPRP